MKETWEKWKKRIWPGIGVLLGGVIIWSLWEVTVPPMAWKILWGTAISLIGIVVIATLVIWWWKKGHKVKPGLILRWILALLAVLAIVVALFTWYQHEENKRAELAALETARTSSWAVVTPKEVWTFSYTDINNGTQQHFELEVTNRDDGVLDATWQRDEAGRKKSFASMKLHQHGDRWVGTWNSYTDDDHGDIDLNEVSHNIWVGRFDFTDKTDRICTLKLRVQ